MKMMTQNRTAQLESMMAETRAATLALFDLVPEEHLHRSPGHGFRPIIWHLAHIGVFEAYWILQRIGGQAAPDERYERIFDPIKTPREDSKELPSRGAMEDFLAHVRNRSLPVVRATELSPDDPLRRGGYVFDLVLEHEYQHQETLAYLLQLLEQPKSASGFAAARIKEQPQPAPRDMITVPGGRLQIGSPWDSFAYDNELPAQYVDLPAFQIDRCLTTNAEYAEFVAAGAYDRREWWSDEGWTWREREQWTQPRYWSRRDDKWFVRTMFDESELKPDHPVSGVSWYEADAYARFRGRRLPTETEWEKAACWDARAQHKRRYAWGDDQPDATRCNYRFKFWETTPVGAFPEGASSYGCLDMTGNVWEWTADRFRGFPGFQAFPYPEYSEAWFDDDHRVLKGGSWASQPSILRTSFRNFFRRHFRIAFAGFRLAQDA